MLHRLRHKHLRVRVFAALALCLLSLQFVRFEHVHGEEIHPAGQHYCQLCSQIDRLGHAPPAGVETPLPERRHARPAGQVFVSHLPRPHYRNARPRAPPHA